MSKFFDFFDTFLNHVDSFDIMGEIMLAENMSKFFLFIDISPRYVDLVDTILRQKGGVIAFTDARYNDPRDLDLFHTSHPSPSFTCPSLYGEGHEN